MKLDPTKQRLGFSTGRVGGRKIEVAMENRHRRSRPRQDDDGRHRLQLAASRISGGAVGISSSRERESERERLRDVYVQRESWKVRGGGLRPNKRN
jgi:hypothetical protein